MAEAPPPHVAGGVCNRSAPMTPRLLGEDATAGVTAPFSVGAGDLLPAMTWDPPVAGDGTLLPPFVRHAMLTAAAVGDEGGR